MFQIVLRRYRAIIRMRMIKPTTSSRFRARVFAAHQLFGRIKRCVWLPRNAFNWIAGATLRPSANRPSMIRNIEWIMRCRVAHLGQLSFCKFNHFLWP